jgi:hypothetical protein
LREGARAAGNIRVERGDVLGSAFVGTIIQKGTLVIAMDKDYA